MIHNIGTRVLVLITKAFSVGMGTGQELNIPTYTELRHLHRTQFEKCQLMLVQIEENVGLNRLVNMNKHPKLFLETDFIFICPFCSNDV